MRQWRARWQKRGSTVFFVNGGTRALQDVWILRHGVSVNGKALSVSEATSKTA